jgi:hypothetical protein
MHFDIPQGLNQALMFDLKGASSLLWDEEKFVKLKFGQHHKTSCISSLIMFGRLFFLSRLEESKIKKSY